MPDTDRSGGIKGIRQWDHYWGQGKCVHIYFCTCLKECQLLFIETFILCGLHFDVDVSLGHFMSSL